MKITGAKVRGFLQSPDPNARAILIYGPDEGLVRERAEILAKTALEDLSDPFRLVELTGGDLKGDPARLADEAASMSFGGGRRVVRVRAATDRECGEACKSFLGLDSPSEALVLVEAGDLNPRSNLRKTFEAAKNAAALPCYADDARSLPDVIRETLAKSGLSADREAMGQLLTSLGADRSVTRGELQKLAIYMGAVEGGEPVRVSEADVRACIGDGAATSMDDIIYAAASGNMEGLETNLSRSLAEGTNAVQIMRAAERHFQNLHLARGAMASGKSADEAVRSLRPPVMFKRVDAFRSQLNLWPTERLARAFSILTQAEMDCKTTGLPANAITGRALLTIAQAARAGQRPAPGRR